MPLDFPVIDVHVHLAPGASARLGHLMQQHGFDAVVNLSGGHPFGELTRQISEAQKHPNPIVVFAGLAYEQVRYANAGERMATLLRASHDLGARGLKISKALGLGLRWPDGSLVRVDDARLDPVFEMAGRLDMPVAIHTGDPEAFWLPVDEHNLRREELEAHPGWALHGKRVPTFDELLAQLETRIARHPATTFISVHFGNAAEHPNRVANMLRKYANLYIDTAARIPELGRHPPELLRAFFYEFQDRILYGSDLGIAPIPAPLFLGSSGPEPPQAKDETHFFVSSYRFYETADRAFAHPTPIQGRWTIHGIGLPHSILRKIYHDNAARLLQLETLPRKHH